MARFRSTGWKSMKGGTSMADMTPVEELARDVADQLQPEGIDCELITPDTEKPGLLSCRRPDSGRTVFLLAESADCSHEKAAVMTDSVRQEISPA